MSQAFKAFNFNPQQRAQAMRNIRRSGFNPDNVRAGRSITRDQLLGGNFGGAKRTFFTRGSSTPSRLTPPTQNN